MSTWVVGLLIYALGAVGVLVWHYCASVLNEKYDDGNMHP